MAYKALADVQKKWEPTAQWLNSRVPGHKFSFRVMHLQELDKEIKDGKIDFVLTNPEHLAHLHVRYEINPLATLMTVANNKPVNKFGGVIFTRSDESRFTKLSDLKSAKIAAVDKQSFGGYLMQVWELYSAGLNIQDLDIKLMGFPHESAVFEVLNKNADVGFVRTGVLESLYKKGAVDPSKIKIINPKKSKNFPQELSTELYPEWAFASMPNNDHILVRDIASALMDIRHDMPCAISGEYYGFTPPADYADVHALMVKLGELPMSREFGFRDILIKYSGSVSLFILFGIAASLLALLWLHTNNIRLKKALAQADALVLRDNLLESLGEGVIGVDKNQICTFINNVALAILGIKKEEIVGARICKFLNCNNGRDKCDISGSNFTRNSEDSLIRPNGERYAAKISAMPLYDDSGDSMGIVITISDITKQKEDKAKLKNHELEVKKLAMVAESTDNAVIITNAKREIEWVNDAFTRVTGYELDEVMGKKPARFLQGKKTDLGMIAFMRQKLDAGEPFSVETINYKKNKEEYWAYFSVKPIRDGDGRLTGFFGMQSDITNKKKAEEDLGIALRQSKAANIAKSEFLANMSHEIRTPLNGIIGFIELLKKSLNLSLKEKEYVWLIDKSSKNLLSIINDILDFSKVEANKLEIDPHLHNPKSDYAQTAKLFSSLAREKNITFISFVDPNIPRLIVADSLRIRQILSNLLSNAIKFTPQDGMVTLRIELLSYDDNRCKIGFRILDTGVGIKEENVKKLFNPFSQADMTISREYGGTGLGLAVSQSLANLMGSQIVVSSDHGHGSEFSFEVEADVHEVTRLVLPNTLRVAILTVKFCDDVSLFLDYAQAFGLCISIVDKIDDKDTYDVVFVHVDELQDFHMPFEVMAQKLIIISHHHDKTQPFVNMLSPPLLPLDIYEAICRVASIHNEFEHTNVSNATIGFNAKALIVDDHDVNRILLTEVLQEYGMSSKEASDGCQAFEIFKDELFDIVFMDIHMPKCDGVMGLGLIREFESQNNLRNIPIVALTADAIVGKKEQMLSAGFDSFITKPINTNELDEALRHFLHYKQHQIYKETSKQTHAVENEYFSLSGTAKELGISEAGVLRSYAAYIKSLDESIGLLGLSLEKKERASIVALAHKIKGASANLRINAISELAKSIEERGADEEFDLLREKMDKIRDLATKLPPHTTA